MTKVLKSQIKKWNRWDNVKADERDINWTNAKELWERNKIWQNTRFRRGTRKREWRLATVVTKRKKGDELLIMDWFLHFFQGLLFLSPSRWMVIAPPALIMCWIGKKTGVKRFYGNWESILLEVGLLQLCFFSPSQKLALPCTETDVHPCQSARQHH